MGGSMNGRTGLFSVLALLLSILVFCESSTPSENGPGAQSTLKAVDFRVTTQIAGWLQDTSQYAFEKFDPDSLYDIIDGGAAEYTSRGLIEGIKVKMNRVTESGTNTATIFVMDFGTDSTANAMYLEKVPMVSKKWVIEGISENSALIDTAFFEACEVYACFGHFFFNGTFSNFALETDAVTQAALFVNYFKKKAG
jgi:hypothetical protein